METCSYFYKYLLWSVTVITFVAKVCFYCTNQMLHYAIEIDGFLLHCLKPVPHKFDC
jgi:hypothetical protein